MSLQTGKKGNGAGRNTPRRTLPFKEKVLLYDYLKEKCRCTGVSPDGVQIAAYDTPWTDDLIAEQFSKSHPEFAPVTFHIVSALRRRNIGEFVSAVSPKTNKANGFVVFSTRLDSHAVELAGLRTALAAVTARVQDLEEWATSRNVAPFQRPV